MEPFSILNKTSKYGVILFLASAAFLTIGEFTKGIAWLSFLLGTVKLILCIWILYYAMREYARHFNLYRASRVFSYGFGISIMANLAYCIYMLLHYSVFFPIDESQIRSIVDAMDMGSMEGMEGMDINQIVDIIVGNYPEMMTFGSIIYLTFFSLIATLIIAQFAKSKSPFKAKKSDLDDII